MKFFEKCKAYIDLDTDQWVTKYKIFGMTVWCSRKPYTYRP